MSTSPAGRAGNTSHLAPSVVIDDLRVASVPGFGQFQPAPAVSLSVGGVRQWKLLAWTASRRADATATLQNPLQETVDLRIADLSAQPGVVHQQAAVLLLEGFDHPQGWPTLESATMEVERVLHEGFAIGALEDALLLG